LPDRERENALRDVYTRAEYAAALFACLFARRRRSPAGATKASLREMLFALTPCFIFRPECRAQGNRAHGDIASSASATYAMLRAQLCPAELVRVAQCVWFKSSFNRRHLITDGISPSTPAAGRSSPVLNRHATSRRHACSFARMPPPSGMVGCVHRSRRVTRVMNGVLQPIG